MKSLFRCAAAIAVLAILFCSALPAAGVQTANNTDVEIRTALQARLKSGTDTGIAVGIVAPSGRRVIVAGTAGPGGKPALDARTVFEIGSATKVFTTALLADMVRRGAVRLEEPVASLLPKTVRVPARGDRTITLLDLATHTSGLPRLPTNLQPKDPSNPYADYTVEQLYAFLSSYEITRDIGETYEYSNLGMGLLGHALACREGKSFGTLLAERILGPLGMRDTMISLSPSARARLAVGHDAAGEPVANWDIPTLAGAGALRSTLDDMMRFVEANLDASAGAVPSALRFTHAARHDLPTPGGGAVGLGWHIRRVFDRTIVWHNGGTAGYHSFVGFDPASRAGVVVLHNSASSIDDIGFHLIEPRLPLAEPQKPAAERREVPVPERALEAHVGTYQLAPAFSIAVTLEGGRLYIQPTGQGKSPIYAASEVEFFLKIVDAQITFERDAEGRTVRLVLHQNGRDIPGERVR